jgi:hypothetical protein
VLASVKLRYWRPVSATLAQSIAAAGEGQGHLVLIDGPAGIGKTRLLAEMRKQAAPSMAVLLRERGAPEDQVATQLLSAPGPRHGLGGGPAVPCRAGGQAQGRRRQCSGLPAPRWPNRRRRTPKTVELHLSSAYRKLGIRPRRELPAALVPR